MARTRMPAELFPPGTFIKEEIEQRGWTQQELARRMGRPLSAVNMILNGRKGLTPDTALELEMALGVSAETWLNLEMSYRLWLARLQHKRKSA
jgi:HTH-type transcriptional regulator / antitoxin HigA